QRTAVLALLFAERRALLEAGRRPPLMLLDDVMSELDARHRASLATRLAEGDRAGPPAGWVRARRGGIAPRRADHPTGRAAAERRPGGMSLRRSTRPL